jgi:hypothetical protein
MVLDNYSFENTARAVYIMNDSAKDLYDSWEELRDFMVSMAYQYAHNVTSFSTGGFQLSFSPTSADPAEKFVVASVSAYTAMRYIESLKEFA